MSQSVAFGLKIPSVRKPARSGFQLCFFFCSFRRMCTSTVRNGTNCLRKEPGNQSKLWQSYLRSSSSYEKFIVLWHQKWRLVTLTVVRALTELSQAKFRRRTSHEPNRMSMRENKGFFSFAFDSAHVKYGV